MALIKKLNGKSPIIGKNTFLADNATIIGDVVMGENCSIWFNAVVRGDVHYIRIGDNVNIQDGVVIHCTYKKAAVNIGNNVSIAHNAIVQGCTIKDNVLIGMGASIMEEAVIEKGGAKRMGTWAFSYGYTNTAALGEFAKIMLEKGVDATTFKKSFKPTELFETYGKFTPGAEWNGSIYTDLQTGVKKKNHILVYQDTYVFGLGYLNMTEVEVPEKYFTIK